MDFSKVLCIHEIKMKIPDLLPIPLIYFCFKHNFDVSQLKFFEIIYNFKIKVLAHQHVKTITLYLLAFNILIIFQ